MILHQFNFFNINEKITSLIQTHPKLMFSDIIRNPCQFCAIKHKETLRIPCTASTLYAKHPWRNPLHKYVNNWMKTNVCALTLGGWKMLRENNGPCIRVLIQWIVCFIFLVIGAKVWKKIFGKDRNVRSRQR